jgi:hypothetical protein
MESANPSRDGMERHHIVLQGTCNKDIFPKKMLQNPANVIFLPKEIHGNISRFYNSIRSFTNGLRVHEWISKKSFKEKYEFGIDIVKKNGGGEYLPGGSKYSPIKPYVPK